MVLQSESVNVFQALALSVATYWLISSAYWAARRLLSKFVPFRNTLIPTHYPVLWPIKVRRNVLHLWYSPYFQNLIYRFLYWPPVLTLYSKYLCIDFLAICVFYRLAIKVMFVWVLLLKRDDFSNTELLL